MHGRRKKNRRQYKWIIVLLSISLAAVLAPRSWTGRFISLVQVVVPFQDAVGSVADSVAERFESDQPMVDADAYDTLANEKAALEHQVAALSVRLNNLEEEVSLLSATRLWDVGGGRLGAGGQLIPARIITEDILPWRTSRLIDSGTLQGVGRHARVISRYFTVGLGTEQGVRHGLATLLGETLVGVVEQVGTHTSRVKLISDVSVEMKVLIGRAGDGGFEALDRYYWLVGRGKCLMEIRDVDRREVESGAIAVGDVVLSDAESPLLPASMTIGYVDAIKPDRENPLLSILSVRAAVDPSMLKRVYVFDPQAHVDADD